MEACLSGELIFFDGLEFKSANTAFYIFGSRYYFSKSGQVGQPVANTVPWRGPVTPEAIIANARGYPHEIGIHRVGVARALLNALVAFALAGVFALALDND